MTTLELVSDRIRLEHLDTHGFTRRFYYHVPHFVHTIRGGRTPKVDYRKTGIPAYTIREAMASHMFGKEHGAGKYVWLSETPLREDALKIDISKLRGENLRWTGQTEGHLLHRGDIPAKAIVGGEPPATARRTTRNRQTRTSKKTPATLKGVHRGAI